MERINKWKFLFLSVDDDDCFGRGEKREKKSLWSDSREMPKKQHKQRNAYDRFSRTSPKANEINNAEIMQFSFGSNGIRARLWHNFSSTVKLSNQLPCHKAID